MAFASNNPFRTAVLPHAVSTDPFNPTPLPMSPSHSAPASAYRAPSFNSKNPFLDVLDSNSTGSSAESVLLRRSTSDSSHENIRPLPDLLLDLSIREEDGMHNTMRPPPPPPPRSNRRHNLHLELERPDELRRQRGSDWPAVGSVGITDAYMPLDRDNKPREASVPSRNRSIRTGQHSRTHLDQRQPSGAKEHDPFATPPSSAANNPKYVHRHAMSTPAVQSNNGTSSSNDRSSRRDQDDISHHKSRSQTGKSPTKEKQHHHGKNSSQTAKSSLSVSKKQNLALDKIDKLDVTGIFGTGFHHDGPFDACNPHRNTNKKKAPMLAFPADSENNALGAPRHLMADTKPKGAPRVLGDGVNGSDAIRFDPGLKADPVHGDISLGLGSSTFLEGAPASKAAIMQQRMKEKESEAIMVDFSKIGAGGAGSSTPELNGSVSGPGLTRKKSIVQKIIGINNTKDRDNARSQLQPINVAAANASTRSRSLSADFRKGSVGAVIFEEGSPLDGSDGKVPTVTTAPAGMIRQSSSPGSTVSFASQTVSPISPNENGGTLLKRVRSLKVGSRKRAE
ncbi:hypothetical protein V1509DRAFT_623810 [Lipomyces kononenkoae]